MTETFATVGTQPEEDKATEDKPVPSSYEFARLATDKAKLCPDALTQNPAPRVGVVIEKNGVMLGWAAKGAGGEHLVGGAMCPFKSTPNQHAEEALLAALNITDLSGASAYVTLEPCHRRKKGTSCAQLLIDRGITTVYVGNCDPNPDIGALAWRTFHQHNVAVKDFPSELRNEARRDNARFFDKFFWSKGESGNGAFDYESSGGERILGPSGVRFRTRWINRGKGSIYALDYEHNVCLAKNCSTFEQVDDPSRWFEDSHYTKPVVEGEIVIFRNEHGFALVKVLEVSPSGPGVNAELRFAYELRWRKR